MENFLSYVDMCKDVIAYYKRMYSYLGKAGMDDIEQECLMAIDKASRMYNSNLGSFKAYATGWIRTNVYTYINALESPVAISRESNRKIRKIKKCIEENPNITTDKISELTGYSKDVVLTYYQGFYKKSLNSKISCDDEVELTDTIADNSYEDRNKILLQEELLRRIEGILNKDELDLIYSFYGIGREKLTQSELSRRLGITHQAVSKKINSIIKRLHSELEAECGLYLYKNSDKGSGKTLLFVNYSKILNSFGDYATL